VRDKIWKRKEYETWDDAFRALIPIVRQQSVRVASDTQVLFVQACSSSYGHHTLSGMEQIVGDYAELAYKCGMYHQLGKALVPDEYQLWQKDFTEEETAVYRKYTTDGRLLVARLQARSVRAKASKNPNEEIPTDNIPWKMIREACEQHMERWDGSGFPEGRAGDEISPIAQIVGLAKELDRLTSETRSEDPFIEAYENLISRAGTDFSPELIDVLVNAQEKTREVYEKYIHYTMAIPQTIPLVTRNRQRPMGLKYRPMIDVVSGRITAYEAEPWFGGMENYPADGFETIEEIEPRLIRLGMVSEMEYYFLYEAADTVLRIETCKLALDAVVLQVLPSFYACKFQQEPFDKLWIDQPIDRSKLILTVPQSVLIDAKRETMENIRRYAKLGVSLMLDDWSPEEVSPEIIDKMGFTYVRPKAELFLKRETADLLTSLIEKGIGVYAKDANSDDAMRWLAACGVRHMRGAGTGVPVDEDEMIREAILRERSHA
jgi:EAL domain-containing protein (putative c-di-GMP-specific phosphodiesterase class I)